LDKQYQKETGTFHGADYTGNAPTSRRLRTPQNNQPAYDWLTSFMPLAAGTRFGPYEILASIVAVGMGGIRARAN
jgi:hypothetical protein